MKKVLALYLFVIALSYAVGLKFPIWYWGLPSVAYGLGWLISNALLVLLRIL